ncbi:MAG: type I-E CRISPR-associated protein Cse1/CasA [gamma proteobacterium endosymbiont of Lamellibrachia anaximandri]|nr:type I-E CRISPR-associated protein Cse1/CasA [gamma proteobacterium endosymbiont of Lamellibrachia anaximandri]MBL3533844.1 type I-E CRISPR-associated protein Cse1/CasA [gamma proteobacterium endosymbiont of Lamellibrachia anaximandri]
MNLLEDKWLPIHTTQGETHIAPWQISDPDMLALAAPRPDFNGALLQFLIGLLQTACPPDDNNQWGEWLENLPVPETLRQLFEPYEAAFNLDADGPKFMQDYAPLDGVLKPIANLLIETPGDKALRENRDHFIKRGNVNNICPNCAATALFTLQTNAPEGGRGYRTSLRGGGPLTTLVALDTHHDSGNNQQLANSLWRDCWLNVLNKGDLPTLSGNTDLSEPPAIFPWLSSTRTSHGKGDITTPKDAHPLQMYWGMPRRIRLDWKQTTRGSCDLCGKESDSLISRCDTKNYGINYDGPWKHPLSPHINNKDGLALPQHAQPGGLQYQHWLGLISTGTNNHPAKIITSFLESEGTGRQLQGEQLRIHAFGYDMKSNKSRCWYETTFPLFPLDATIREQFIEIAEILIETATGVASMTRSSIKEAWFKRPGDAKGDTNFLQEAFFSHTENAFFTALKTLKDQLDKDQNETQILREWHRTLCDSAFQLFDYWTSRGDFETVNPRRIATAHKKLKNWLYSKKLKEKLQLNNKEKAA